MNRRTGCLILAILFTFFFVFGGMLCRITLPISPSPDAGNRLPNGLERHSELHGVLDMVNGKQVALSVQVDADKINTPGGL